VTPISILHAKIIGHLESMTSAILYDGKICQSMKAKLIIIFNYFTHSSLAIVFELAETALLAISPHGALAIATSTNAKANKAQLGVNTTINPSISHTINHTFNHIINHTISRTISHLHTDDRGRKIVFCDCKLGIQ
jgi:hypothetical protein